MWAGIATAAGWVLFVLAGLYLRSRSPQSRVYVHLLTFYWYSGTAYMIHCFGIATSPVAMQLLVGAMVGLVLWDLRCTIPSLGLSVVVLLALVFAERAEWIPYAPLLAAPPFVDGRISNIWLATMVGLFFAMASFVFAVFATVILRWRDREAQLAELNRFLRKTFGRYLSKEVLQTLLADPRAVELGGQRRKVSILMADIRGFTQLSERLEPEQVVRILNRYLRVMTEICDRHRGTVSDIVGDALMVTFGAPQQMSDHAEAAVACGIEMQNAVASINRENAREGLAPIEIGIGLNTAEVIVGNIGSEARSKYGVVGSGVNMASRIESYAVGGQVLISQSVLEETGDSLRVDHGTQVFPKGAQEAFAIYEVGGVAGRYNVILDRAPDRFRKPPKPLVLSYAVLSGKHIGSETGEVEVSELSNTGVLFTSREPFDVHVQLKLNLTGVSPLLAQSNFYGKVVAASSGEPATLRVRFTSVPAEIAAYFEGLIGPNPSAGTHWEPL